MKKKTERRRKQPMAWKDVVIRRGSGDKMSDSNEENTIKGSIAVRDEKSHEENK